MSDACCGPAVATDRSDDDADHADPTPWYRDRSLALPVASGVFWVVGLILALTGADLPAIIVYALGLAAGGATFVPGTLRQLVRQKGRDRLGVGLLMTIAAVGAVLLGHVGEAAALAFLFSIAEALEDRAMDRARNSLRALLDLMPETARVRCPDGCFDPVPAADVRRGDVLQLGAGERLATDGTVLTGHSSLDTSAVTGESVPVEVAPGDTALAGSVNTSGTLTVEATADGRDNSLTRIVSLVEQAQARKGVRARLADRVARPLVPAVLVVAALTAVLGCLFGNPEVWIDRALVVLVAASPCAMAIAVPVTVISAIGAASRLGVAVTSGAAFEELGTIRTVCLDKTGTLTRNEPRVVEVRTAPGVDGAQVLASAAALEMSSTHPLAAAVITAATDVPDATDVAETAGRGLTGTVAGRHVRVGGDRWIDPGDLAQDAAELAGLGMSLIVVEVDGAVTGVIGVRDELRPEAAEAVADLHGQGIATVMLTGDNGRTAAALAAQAGIDEVHAGLRPEDKERYVRDAASRTPTAMIGDGINDTPALASATVGIAIGTGGSAAAVDSADVTFTGADLRLIPAALAHARRGRRIMTANMALALLIIVVLCPLALTGVLGLAAVVLVHESAEVVVIANGLRAARTAGLTV
ncbi:heavy metal translocating P-type ATPase [Corynebacterium nuruki]|jgi:cation-transporting ATPase G|uniref:heavy metal translocating P-type ATPase n=1 Tax=Corynebacterium nuruki TaxID=1032851 RepID=UPI002356A2DD